MRVNLLQMKKIERAKTKEEDENETKSKTKTVDSICCELHIAIDLNTDCVILSEISRKWLVYVLQNAERLINHYTRK